MLKFGVKVDMKDVPKKVDRAFSYAQFAVDKQVLKDSNYYIPMDEGYLEKSGILHSKLGKGEVIWQTPYARRLYYNPQYNFSDDENENARGLWFEAAKAKKIKNWLATGNKAVRSKL